MDTKAHLLIRADAHTAIGSGHVMRCLALAQACGRMGGTAAFLSFCPSEALRQRILKDGFELYRIEKVHPDPLDLAETLRIYSIVSGRISGRLWFVLDGYHFDTSYQERLKEAGIPLMVIDDMAHLPFYSADLIVNQNVSGDRMSYACPAGTQLLLGSRYAMLRNEFLASRDRVREIPDVARKILVTMGGSDLQNVTPRILRALREIRLESMEGRVVIGPSNPHREEIEEELRLMPAGFSPLFAPEDMPGLMAWADLAVSGGGATCLEMCFMGLPSLIAVLSENQRRGAEGLEEKECARNLGPFDRLSTAMLVEEIGSLIADKAARTRMSHAGRDTVDGLGAERILETASGGFRQ